MTPSKYINVNEILGSTLNSREATYDVFKGIEFNKINFIQLDFNGVEFMSRSFADEFFKYRRTLEAEKNIRIDFVNINKEISIILQAVSNSNTDGLLNRKSSNFNHIQFTTQEALSNYLLAL